MIRQNNDLTILNSFLNKVKDHIKEFDLSKSDNDNQATLVTFTDCILIILDNSFNKYPGTNNDDFYPRPKLNESKAEYINRLKEIPKLKKRKSKKPIIITSSLRRFLLQIFDINQDHRQAVSLLTSKEKHNVNTKVHSMKDQNLEYSLLTTQSENPIHMNRDESMDIGDFIHAEKGASVKIQNSKIVTPEHTIHVNDLRYYPVNNGVVNFDGTNRNAIEWMNDCVTICEKLIKIINNKLQT